LDSRAESLVGFGDTLRFPELPIPVSLNWGSTANQNVHTNRTLQLNSASTFESVFGGSGNDFLTGNSLRNYLYGQTGHDILVGDAGNDILDGGTGRDILIGGLGIDTLNGGTGEDILIGGTTSSSRLLDLNAVRNKWTARGSYEDRVASIKSGPASESLIANVNVFDDGSVDHLTGGDHRDWFFGSFFGDQSDRDENEAWKNLI
jgi:Ca2+-binding RTX toxin-like protein